MGRKGKKFVDECPEVVSMLHPTKNEGVDISSLNQSSTQVLWWVCPTTGLEYEAKVSNQVRMGVKSPFEAGTIPIPGENDFATMHPDLAAQWHPTKNGDLSPDSILPSSNRKVWWLCPISGGEWQATPNHRTRDNALLDSPFKQNKKLLRGYNDLASRSDVANEWHPTKNGDLTPEMVTVGSGKKVWWLCPISGGEWQAVIHKRTSGDGSPFVANKVVLAGYNDISSNFPSIAAQWHPTMNGNLTPDQVFYGSTKKVWWLCPTYNLPFDSSPRDRVKFGVQTPFETGQRVAPGFNDLQTLNPELAAQWDFERNDVTPDQVAPFSNKKFWWVCDKTGRSWKSSPASKSRNPIPSSPFCNRLKGTRIVKPGFDLATTHPEVASQWHPTMNGDLTPDMVTYGSHEKVWWLCPESGMAWNAEIKSKVTQGYGSPYISRKRVAPGYNDVATTHPDLIKEWSSKNRSITPDMFLSGSSEKVWWECEKGHEWESSIDSRSKGSQCPQCVISGTSRKEIAMREYIESIAPDSVSVIANDRIVLSENRGKLGGVELDVLIPEVGIAFEFNGDYWHSFKPEGYHEAKSLRAKEKGVAVFHIWEKDWDSNGEFVKSHIKEVIDDAMELKVGNTG